MRLLFLTLFCMAITASAFGQNECFDDLLQKGKVQYDSGYFNKAIIKWQGALDCPDLTSTQQKTLIDWLDKAKNPTPSVSTLIQQSYEPEMIFVQGGTFQMGSNNNYDNEKPIHSVTVGNFYMGKYEVTQKQWRDIMGSDPLELNFKGCNDCPVEGVSWNDIQEYLQKLIKKTGKKYRLPTEAEWEYAARGGNQAKDFKYSGSNTVGDVAWYFLNSDNKTHQVGKKQANELGFFDMSGNVYEWCSDWYNKEYYRNSPSRNPKGSTTGNYRVIRGGSLINYDFVCRVAYRNNINPANRNINVGFRIARIE